MNLKIVWRHRLVSIFSTIQTISDDVTFFGLFTVDIGPNELTNLGFWVDFEHVFLS